MSDAERGAHNVELVAAYIEAMNGWDFERMRSLLSEDAVFEMPYAPAPFNRKVSGRDAIITQVEELPAMIETENLHDLETSPLADPDQLVSTYLSDMEIGPPDQKSRYRNRYIAQWTIRDGKIAFFAEFYDPVPLVEALGGTVNVPASKRGGGTAPQR